MPNTTKYDDYVIKSIISKNKYGITNIYNLASIKVVYCNFSNYSKIEQIIIWQNFDDLSDSGENDVPRQYLEIMQFEDQENRHFYVAVYDSDKLWQNPEAIEIYPKK